MSSPPRLPIHVGDYLKDTPPIGRVNWEHHGIYLLALFISWTVPRCRLPTDAKWLSERFGCSVPEYEEHVLPVLRRYFKKRANFWEQKRLREEFEFVSKRSEKQRRNAKSLWKKKNDHSHGIVLAEPKDGSGSAPTPTPTPTQEERTKIVLPDLELDQHLPKRANGHAVVPDLVAKVEAGGFSEWYAAYPRKVGKGHAVKAYATARKHATAEQLIDGAKRYAQSREGENPKFTQHPASWLNAQGWLDELPPTAAEVQARLVARVSEVSGADCERQLRNLNLHFRGDAQKALALVERAVKESDRTQSANGWLHQWMFKNGANGVTAVGDFA